MENAFNYAVLQSLKSIYNLASNIVIIRSNPFYLNEVPIEIVPQNGAFKNVKLSFLVIFPEDFPFKPPKIVSLQKILHPNILHSYKVCMKLLTSNWRSDCQLKEVLLSLLCLLEEPNFDDYANYYAVDYHKYGLYESEVRRRLPL